MSSEKLVQYVLNPDHSRGCHKARVLLSALGIAQADWRYLRDQLVVLVDGLNGSTHPVATVWLVAEEDVPRLVSSWVDIPLTPCDKSKTVTAPRHTEFEVVELLTESGRLPAGPVGTVIEASGTSALVEIADDRGHAIDFVSLPHDALAQVEAAAARAAS